MKAFNTYEGGLKRPWMKINLVKISGLLDTLSVAEAGGNPTALSLANEAGIVAN